MEQMANRVYKTWYGAGGGGGDGMGGWCLYSTTKAAVFSALQG